MATPELARVYELILELQNQRDEFKSRAIRAEHGVEVCMIEIRTLRKEIAELTDDKGPKHETEDRNIPIG